MKACLQGLSVFAAEGVQYPRLNFAAEGVYRNIFACLLQKRAFSGDFRREHGSEMPKLSAIGF